MIDDVILCHEEREQLPYAQFIAFHMRRSGNGVPSGETRGEVYARIDDGRWIADCQNRDPETGETLCRGAVVLSRIDHRFICPDCGSPENAGNWYEVRFPENREEIEALLLARPAKMGRRRAPDGVRWYGPRFWTPVQVSVETPDTIYLLQAPQTVKDLRRENEELAV